MTNESLMVSLERLEDELRSMDPCRVASAEELMQDILLVLKREGLQDIDAKGRAIAVDAIRRLRMLTEHASCLYEGCLNVVYSTACGYTATGPAPLKFHSRSLAEA